MDERARSRAPGWVILLAGVITLVLAPLAGYLFAEGQYAGSAFAFLGAVVAGPVAFAALVDIRQGF